VPEICFFNTNYWVTQWGESGKAILNETQTLLSTMQRVSVC